MKAKIRTLDEHGHWFAKEKNVKWATQDKDGNWWLINGSEFPEAQIKKGKKKMNCGMPPTFDFKSFFINIFYVMLLGFSLGLNVFLLFTK